MQNNKVVNPEEDKRIDEIINKIDAFMAKGGGRISIATGDGESKETFCTTCCGESTDTACNTPVKKSEE